MGTETWTLTDVAAGIHKADFSVGNENWSASQRTLRGGLSDGVDLVEINNGRLRLFVLPTRGMGIWKAILGANNGDDTLGWKSPVRGPVHPKFVPLTEPSGLGWLDGFDEFLVRCGLESNGAPEFDDRDHLRYPLHGRIANRPAHFVEVTVDDDAGTISVRGIVEETRFHFQKLRLTSTITTGFDSAAFTVHDEVENIGGTPAEMQMLYHINFGEPLLTEGDEVVAAVRTIEGRNADAVAGMETWHQIGPAIAGQPEQCFYMTLNADSAEETDVLLKNAAGTAGTVVKFDTESLPCFTLWKNPVASEDGYVAALEPGTNYPNPRSEEARQGRVVPLLPGETWSTVLSVRRLTTADEVRDAEHAIRGLRGDH